MRENGRLDVPEEAIEMIGAESPIPNHQDFKNHMFLMNICADLRMALIKNISSLPFITSDHPVVKYNQLFMSHGYYKAYEKLHADSVVINAPVALHGIHTRLISGKLIHQHIQPRMDLAVVRAVDHAGHTAVTGESVNAFVQRAIWETIERDVAEGRRATKVDAE